LIIASLFEMPQPAVGAGPQFKTSELLTRHIIKTLCSLIAMSGDGKKAL
jgi:hypothetical protein